MIQHCPARGGELIHASASLLDPVKATTPGVVQLEIHSLVWVAAATGFSPWTTAAIPNPSTSEHPSETKAIEVARIGLARRGSAAVPSGGGESGEAACTPGFCLTRHGGGDPSPEVSGEILLNAW